MAEKELEVSLRFGHDEQMALQAKDPEAHMDPAIIDAWKNEHIRLSVYKEIFQKFIYPFVKKELIRLSREVDFNNKENKDIYLILGDMNTYEYFYDQLEVEEQDLKLIREIIVFFLDNFFYSKEFDKNRFYSQIDGLRKKHFLEFISILNEMYELGGYNPTMVYTLPVLNNKSGPSSFLRKNLNFIVSSTSNHKNYFKKLDINKVPRDHWIVKYEIDKFLGEGVFGAAYSFKKQNFIIKLYSYSASEARVKKDTLRYSKMAKRAFGGQSSLDELHIFDYGKLKTIDKGFYIYYAIMPRLVADRQKFLPYLDTMIVASRILRRYVDGPSSGRWPTINQVISYMNNQYRVLDEKEKQIVTACYNAALVYGGTDFHPGNIGYFKGHEDKPFFFDM
jgi:hypothetical protein